MKSGFLALALVSLVSRGVWAEEPAPAAAEPPSSYMSFGVGGFFPMSGDLYDVMDDRFQLQLEFGGKYGGFPMSVSFGQDVLQVAARPGFHYFFAPVSALPKLTIGPGVAFAFNYWKFDSAGMDGNAIELGMQASVSTRYDVMEHLFVFFTPFAMDFNFWRQYWGTPADTSDSDLYTSYSLMGGIGFRY